MKIDRSFVQGMATDPGDLAIVRAIVELTRSLGLAVVAEGVESELTLSLLDEMGCDIGQGFLFSRPLPYDRLEAWIAARTDTDDRFGERASGGSERCSENAGGYRFASPGTRLCTLTRCTISCEISAPP